MDIEVRFHPNYEFEGALLVWRRRDADPGDSWKPLWLQENQDPSVTGLSDSMVAGDGWIPLVAARDFDPQIRIHTVDREQTLVWLPGDGSLHTPALSTGVQGFMGDTLMLRVLKAHLETALENVEKGLSPIFHLTPMPLSGPED